MILIQAKLKIQENKESSFLESIQSLITLSQKEEGNISYQLVKSVQEINEFIMLEAWRDRAAIEKHNKSEHFQSFTSVAPNFMAAPLEVKIYHAEEMKA